MRPSPIRALTLAGLIVAVLSACAPPAEVSAALAGSRPNVLFILADDLRYDSVGAAGNRAIRTPNLDRLAAEGVRFTDFFLATPLCCPSRASFLTGQYWWKHGVRTNSHRLRSSAPQWPLLLQTAGYRTGFVGKWHIEAKKDEEADRPRPGFSEWVCLKLPTESGKRPVVNVNGERREVTDNLTDYFTGQADRLLESFRDEPFAILLAYTAPHEPYDPSLTAANLYEDVEFPFPAAYDEDGTGKARILDTSKQRRETYERSYQPPEVWQHTARRYARMVTTLDEGVGRLLDRLETLNLDRSTLVIFTSDNGRLMGEHRLGGKDLIYEESIRAPLILRYPPRLEAGGSIQAMTLNVDIAPTLLEMAGVPVPEAMQGRSVVELLEGDAPVWRDVFLASSGRGHPDDRIGPPIVTGVRTARHKLAIYSDGERELYDLETDRHEMRNLAGDPEWAEQERRLFDQYQMLLDRLEAKQIFQSPELLRRP